MLSTRTRSKYKGLHWALWYFGKCRWQLYCIKCPSQLWSTQSSVSNGVDKFCRFGKSFHYYQSCLFASFLHCHILWIGKCLEDLSKRGKGENMWLTECLNYLSDSSENKFLHPLRKRHVDHFTGRNFLDQNQTCRQYLMMFIMDKTQYSLKCKQFLGESAWK